MKHLILAAFALFATAPAATAAETTTVWRPVPISGGCLVVLAVGGDLPAGEVSWNGVCTPQQAINGPGILRIDLASTNLVMLLETTFVSGVPHGDSTFSVIDGNGVPIDAATPATFNMGCVVQENAAPCDPYVP